jgi:hypothetical protein
MKRIAAIAAALVAGLLWTQASRAGDFVQVPRDPDFVKAARRQDSELLKFYGNQVPAGIRFCHNGSFKATVHRNGLDRPITLVPAEQMKFEDHTALKDAARGGDVIVGAIKLTYGSLEPQIVPGTILLLYDGLRVHLHDTHSQDIGQYSATIGPLPAGASVDPALGGLGETDHSIGSILPDGTFQIYLQLANSKGEAIREGQAFKKVLLQFSIPGLVDDDDSAPLQLVEPKPEA